jgi:hypothetical protein
VALSRLLPGLQTLIEDLVSVGASDTDLEPLQELLKSLRDAISRGNWRQPAMELLQIAESVLSAFADATALPAPGDGSAPRVRREQFWA